MKEELDALERPLKQGLILRMMSNPQNNKRSACLEDPTKPEFEQDHSYHDSLLLSFALKGVMETFSNGGGYTQDRARIGSATGSDNCDSWLLRRNTLLAKYEKEKFIVSAMKGIYTKDEFKRGKGETLDSAYQELNSLLR